MDFTPLYGSSSTLWSPDGQRVLLVCGSLVVLREAATFQVIRSWRVDTWNGSAASSHLLSISFSDTASHVLVYDPKAETAAVFAVESDSDSPVLQVDAHDTMDGMQGARLLGDYLATWARCARAVHLYDIYTGRQFTITSPRRGVNSGWAVTRALESPFLAILERHRGRDHLGMYNLDTPSLVRHFALPSSDAVDISWSPCGSYIAVWESSLDYTIHIMTPTGQHLSTYSLTSPTFPSSLPNAPLQTLLGLGIRSVLWHPSGRFLCLAGYDDTVRILEDVTWSCAVEIGVPWSTWGKKVATASAIGSTKRVPLHKEPSNWLGSSAGIIEFDAILPSLTSISSTTTSKASVKSASASHLGISHLSFSPTSSHLAIVSSTTPLSASRILILRFAQSSPALPFTPLRPRVACILECRLPVQGIAWRPTGDVGSRHALAVCTGEKSVIIWRSSRPSVSGQGEDEDYGEEGEGEASHEEYHNPARYAGVTEGVGIPSKTEFGATSVSWSPDGQAILVQGRPGKFCLAYPLDE